MKDEEFLCKKMDLTEVHQATLCEVSIILKRDLPNFEPTSNEEKKTRKIDPLHLEQVNLDDLTNRRIKKRQLHMANPRGPLTVSSWPPWIVPPMIINLMGETSTIGLALYKSKWYEGHAKIMKDVLLVLLKCEKPAIMEAVPLGTLDYPLFLLNTAENALYNL
ncbi:hypothetical protein NQ318_010620 [Aromia moschata]|uniref:Uncharacterized protein n=1 Tax=Aromia moschata TaxID=1265417 RepID=A0AAV8XKM3_9CUCU|nr:hypothetical protein NQ318_010620 [Aromia moschata]